jgi:hypothetical protein
MIQLPKRSVTRFFIPLIDVLILLFCIFLLMPVVKSTSDLETLAMRDERIVELEREVERLRQQGGANQEELAEKEQQLREARRKALEEGLAVRVLQISPTTGRLYYYDNLGEHEVTEQTASSLIADDRSRLAGTSRELYYLILYPRDRSSIYPLREQRERYDRWFAGVAHGWDVPGSLTGREGAP